MSEERANLIESIKAASAERDYHLDKARGYQQMIEAMNSDLADVDGRTALPLEGP